MVEVGFSQSTGDSIEYKISKERNYQRFIAGILRKTGTREDLEFECFQCLKGARYTGDRLPEAGSSYRSKVACFQSIECVRSSEDLWAEHFQRPRGSRGLSIQWDEACQKPGSARGKDLSEGWVVL
ncbi:hypothetical protein J6590_065384 [Homalodisca vitripennis]|nr:hypothetical protein J6590_065384 [Homalodisca vitripennis]